MKTKNLIILIPFVVLVTVLILTIIYTTLLNTYKEIQIDFSVANQIGINADNDALHFGKIPPGEIGKRSIILTNNDCKKCLINFKVKGDSDWIGVSHNNFIMYSNTKKEIIITVNPPETANHTKYNATLEIYFWRVPL